MLNNRDFGAKIADLRKKKGLTQAQLADMLNISNKTISRWETGEGYPEVTLLSPLAKALGVTVDEMLAEPEPEAESVQEQPDQFESFEQVSGTENKKSKVKKHKDIPVEWPQIQLRGFFKRPTVIINILQIIFFIIFSALAIEFENQKVGLVTAALGLILGACDLYDRQYKASIIIIGANLILPYIISFLSVILFIYPYQTLFN